MDFLDFGTFWWFYLIGAFSDSFGLNDLLQYREKRERAQQEELVKTFVEMVQGGKSLHMLKIWKTYFLKVLLLYPKSFTINCFAGMTGAFSYPLAMKIIFKKYTISAQNLCG